MKKVLLIDSGSGGINILKECVKVCPQCDFLMFCDTKNAPYGNKSKSELVEITLKNLAMIKRFFDFDIVVLACNTLSCTVLDECRNCYKQITFIGTVPAIKPALEKYSAREVLVIATPVTIENNILINKFKDLKVLGFDGLAGDIDRNLDDLSALRKSVLVALSPFKDARAVVLGCTHYVAVAEFIKQALPNAEIFDSANGVARRLKSFLPEQEFPDFKVQFMVSGNDDDLQKFWYYFNK